LRALSLSTPSKSALNLLSVVDQEPHLREQVKLRLRACRVTQAPYFRAWNEQDSDQRRRMLERCVTDDALLLDPTGRWEGSRD
jgi:hypothetical protein